MASGYLSQYPRSGAINNCATIFWASQVTKEFREKLVAGARKKLNSTKDELRSVQNAHTKRMEESDPPPGVSKDDVKEAVAAVRLVTESFIASADQLLVIKTKELMGK